MQQSIVYGNDRRLVAKFLADGTRKRTTLFRGFLSRYLIRDRYGRPGKGNDKGSVEGLAGYARRNFMVPILRFATWDAFNAWLEDQCRKRQRNTWRMNLHSGSYRAMTWMLMQSAERLCEGRLMLCHEGGYSPVLVPFAGLTILETLSGLETGVVDPFRKNVETQADQALMSHQADVIARAGETLDRIPHP